MRAVTSFAFVVAALCPVCLLAQIDQNSFITTFAGAAWTFPANGAAGKNAPISQVASLNTDNSGNIIFADPGNHVVSRINANGTVTVIAGNGVRGFSGDGGPALSASLNNPIDAVMDSDGNLYISDSFNRRIRKVTPSGIISTLYTNIAGARLAILNNNIGFRLRRTLLQTGTRLNNTLYNTDPDNCLIYQTTPDGTLSVFAGNGRCGHSGDGGPATKAMIFPGNGGIAVDYAGNVFLADAGGDCIREITPDGLITTIAGTGSSGFAPDGTPAISASLNFPQSITFDVTGNLYFSDVNNAVVREIDLNGNIHTVAGTGTEGYSGDGGPANKALFIFPKGIGFDGNGNLFISDSGNFRIRSVHGGTSSGSTATVVGNAQFRVVPDGTSAAQAFIFGPDGVAVSPSGNLLITEVAASKVSQIGLSGNLPFQFLAGNGASGANRGFPVAAKKAFLDTPRGIVADGKGNIYYSDNSASVIYKQTPDGNLTVYAGHPLSSGYSGDGGPATQARLVSPFGIALDTKGNLFIADRDANVVREVLAADGTIRTFAGDPTGKSGFGGDKGPATAALLNSPQNVAVDSEGDVLICDRNNNRIRMVTPDGTITTFAGNGKAKTSGDGGPAVDASLNSPFNLTLDRSGNVYELEASGSVIRRIDTSGNITTIAGIPGLLLNSLDGTSAGSALLDVDGMAFDSAGNMYLTSFDSDKVRAIFASPPVFTTTNKSLSFSGLAGGTMTASQAIGVSAALKGVQGDPGAVVSITSDSPWLKVQNTFGSGITPFNVQVQADPSKLSASQSPYKGKISLSRVTANSVAPFVVIPVTFTVGAGSSATLAAQPGSLSASLNSGGAAQTQILQVLNNGSGSLNFSVAASGAGAAAISLSVKSGVVNAGTPVPIAVTINPSPLSAGAYAPTIVISSNGGQSVTVPVTIIVAGAAQMALSQHGFLFTAVKGGGVTPPLPLTVLNIGSGTFQWTASAITLNGSGWLTVTPASGSSTAGSSSGVITVKVDPTKLPNTGVFYGIVRVTSNGTTNAPQDAEVVLNLLSASNSPGAVLTPAGMVFTSPAGTNPSSQTFSITNLNAATLQFRINPGTFDGHAWLQAVPTTTPSPVPAGGSQTITVQPDIQSTNLPPGVYFGTATIDFQSQGSFFSRTLQVLLVVTGSSPAGSNAPLELPLPAATSNACKPQQLYPLFTSFVQDFSVPAAWPIPLEVKVVDNCGSPQTAGSVAVSFSNGDPLLSLQSLNDGRWQGTYFGKNTQAGQLTMGIHANETSPSISGTTNYTGTLSNNSFGPPAVNAGGVGSAALAPAQAPLAPGEIITIQGAGFAPGQASAQLPLQTNLGGNGVFLAGTFLPLIYSSGGLITAIVPYNIKSNAQYLLLVNRKMDGAVSGPQQLAMTTAQPGIFLVDASSDPNLPHKLWSQITTGTRIDASKAAPPNAVKAGDSLVIYCTGLGAVSGTVDVTQPAAANPPAATVTPKVTIGGVTASVSFAGLAPGVTGIYQIKIKVPSGISPGSGVPLIVSSGGQSSMPVKLSVK